MDFRIAPLLLAIFNSIFLSFRGYQYFFDQDYKAISWKIIGIGVIALWMAFGSFKGHHFFTKPYKFAFWSFFTFNAIMIIAGIVILWS
jgi:hypothetical protein